MELDPLGTDRHSLDVSIPKPLIRAKKQGDLYFVATRKLLGFSIDLRRHHSIAGLSDNCCVSVLKNRFLVRSQRGASSLQS